MRKRGTVTAAVTNQKELIELTFPRNHKNPSEEYLKIEKQFKGDEKHVTDEQKLAMMIFKGYRLTRNEYSNAVRLGLIINRTDSDAGYVTFMVKWKETENQFGYMG